MHKLAGSVHKHHVSRLPIGTALGLGLPRRRQHHLSILHLGAKKGDEQ